MTWRTAKILLLLAIILTRANIALSWRDARQGRMNMRQSRLVPIPARNITGFRIAWQDGSVVRCKRTKEGWRVEQPVRDRADHYAIEEVLAMATLGRIGDGVNVSSEAAGLDTPQARMEVEGTDFSVELNFGGITEKENELYVASADHPGKVYSLDRGLAGFMKRGAEGFRARDLLMQTGEDVTRMVLRPAQRDKEIIIARNNDGWMLRSPIIWPADGGKVENILRLMAELQYQDIVMEKAAELPAIGLDKDATTIVVSGEHGSELLRLAPGVGTAKGVALVDGRSAVFAVSDALRAMIDRENVDSLRQRRLEPLAGVDSLGEVRRELDGRVMRLLRKDQSWQGVSPRKFEVDLQQLQAFVTMIEHLTVKEFVSEEISSAGKWGFEKPFFRLQLLDDNGKEVVDLTVGDKAESGNYYARLKDKPAIFTIDKQIVQFLTQPWYAYHLRLLTYFGLKDAKRLSIWRNGHEESYQRTVGDAWQMVKPRTVPADAMALYRGPLSAKGLGELQALAFVGTANDDLSKFGLDQPRLRVVLESALPAALGREGTVSWDIEIGAPTVFGKTKAHYARFRGQDMIFLIDAAVVQMLEKNYAEEFSAP